MTIFLFPLLMLFNIFLDFISFWSIFVLLWDSLNSNLVCVYMSKCVCVCMSVFVYKCMWSTRQKLYLKAFSFNILSLNFYVHVCGICMYLFTYVCSHICGYMCICECLCTYMHMDVNLAADVDSISRKLQFPILEIWLSARSRTDTHQHWSYSHA